MSTETAEPGTKPSSPWTRWREDILMMLRGRTARTASPIAILVGTVLSAVNQGTVIVGGNAVTGTWVRVAINYTVPFLVASAGYLSAQRASLAAAEPGGADQPPG